MFTTEADAVTYIFRSMRKLRGHTRPPDDIGRDPMPTRRLIESLDLLAVVREYMVVTGSKGKGSTTAITAKLLQHQGYQVGAITSPHLVTWRERIRVNGHCIPSADFLRIMNDFVPTIDTIEATLSSTQYFSPTGIFLAVALRWFTEQGVEVAVLEVGRGGRFDDIALVPNHIALLTPIMLEHTYWLGPTVERIAWHKAGIIKPNGHALTVPQSSVVEAVLNRHAAEQNADLTMITPATDCGHGDDGLRFHLEPYGELVLPLLGRYQIINATLAIRAAEALHTRIGGELDARFHDCIRTGLAAVQWPGRLQKLQDSPAVYLDGAVNHDSAQSVVDSLQSRWTAPVISIVAVPADKDHAGVYAALGPVSQTLLLTETDRNPILTFPDQTTALAAANKHNSDVQYIESLEAAIQQAAAVAGEHGTILIVGTQSIVADVILRWGFTYEEI